MYRIIEPYHIVYHIILYHMALYHIVSYHMVSYCIILYYIYIKWYIATYHMVLYYNILYRIILYCVTLSCIILHDITLYRMVSYCLMLYRILSTAALRETQDHLLLLNSWCSSTSLTSWPPVPLVPAKADAEVIMLIIIVQSWRIATASLTSAQTRPRISGSSAAALLV